MVIDAELEKTTISDMISCEMECPRCYGVMCFYSEFNALLYACEDCDFILHAQGKRRWPICSRVEIFVRELGLTAIKEVFTKWEWNIAATVKDTIRRVRHTAFAAAASSGSEAGMQGVRNEEW